MSSEVITQPTEREKKWLEWSSMASKAAKLLYDIHFDMSAEISVHAGEALYNTIYLETNHVSRLIGDYVGEHWPMIIKTDRVCPKCGKKCVQIRGLPNLYCGDESDCGWNDKKDN